MRFYNTIFSCPFSFLILKNSQQFPRNNFPEARLRECAGNTLGLKVINLSVLFFKATTYFCIAADCCTFRFVSPLMSCEAAMQGHGMSKFQSELQLQLQYKHDVVACDMRMGQLQQNQLALACGRPTCAKNLASATLRHIPV